MLFLLHLPQGISAVFHFGEVVEGAGGGEKAAFFLVGLGAAEEVGEAGELGMGAGFHDAFGRGGGESFEAVQAEA